MYTSVRGIDIPLFQEKCQKYLFINVWRKGVFDIYFTEFGAALKTVFLFCSSIVINTVIVTAGDFEP